MDINHKTNNVWISSGFWFKQTNWKTNKKLWDDVGHLHSEHHHQRVTEEFLSYDNGMGFSFFLKSLSLKTTFLKIYRWNHMTAGAAKLLQSCLTLCNPIDGSPPGSPIPGILQARTLDWVAISFSNAWKWKVKVKSLSCVWLLVTLWTVAYQAPPSMGFSRQEYWSGVPVWLPYIIF